MTKSEAQRLKMLIDRMVDGSPASTENAIRGPHDAEDPIVKIVPHSWVGPDFRGKRFSQASHQFLTHLAKHLDDKAAFFADDPDPDRQKYNAWDRATAAKAREWAAKIECSPRVADGVLP